MTREELRGLIGGYSTGTLSEAERKALFEAALEDQELFDELAREQALKEALEEPGAKERLLAAVAPGVSTKSAVTPWWKQGWSWAAIAAACVALFTGIAVLRTSGRVEQIARLEQPALPQPPALETTPSSPALPPAASSVPAAPSAPAASSKLSAPPSAPASPPAPAAAAPKLTTGAALEPPKQAPLEAPRAQSLGRLSPEAPPPAPTPQAAPVPAVPGPAPAPPAIMGFAANGTQDANALAPVPAAPPAVGGGGGGGGIGGRGGGRAGAGRGGAARALAQPLAVRPPPFAFDYSITTEGALRIAPSSNGFLSVYSNDGNTTRNLFFNRPLQSGVPAEIPLPEDCVEAMVVFSVREFPAGFLNVTGPLDPPSGSKSDPNPRPESQLIAVIPVKR